MENITEFLTPIKVTLDDLLLDPNNPRFAELGEEIDAVPEARFAEPKVQKATLDKMKSPKFDVAELRDTIKELGFLPMDRIVLRNWKANSSDKPKKYVVVEGNRRVTALKWLIELHDTAKETFAANQLEQFKNFEALLLDDVNAPQTARWILPGLRHVSGIKEWGPYQKARAVYELRETGKTSQEVAQSLGLSTREANQLWRSYLALEQMKKDEEYGEHAEPRLYSYFEEVFKRPNVRDWLEWSDEDQKFINGERLREFFGWMKGEKREDGELENPKLPEAKSIRELGEFIDDVKALAVFRSSEGSLSRALAKFESEHPEQWSPALTNCESVLAALSADTLRNMTLEEVQLLTSLRARIDRLLEDRTKLIQV